MRMKLLFATPLILFAVCLGLATICPAHGQQAATVRESRIDVGAAELYAREVGKGPAIIVLHGGPDFDQSYLLPEMDRLSDSYRLIYYDQRGRGKSASNVQPEDVTMQSDVEDIESLRAYFYLESVAVLGHSIILRVQHLPFNAIACQPVSENLIFEQLHKWARRFFVALCTTGCRLGEPEGKYRRRQF